MFFLLRIFVLVGIGFYLGLSYKDGQMQRACEAQSGNWDGTICKTAGGS